MVIVLGFVSVAVIVTGYAVIVASSTYVTV
jgi:hypothetical protein